MKSAVVICPGRGTYNRDELGYLKKHFPDPELLARFDDARGAEGQEPLSRLDGRARFSPGVHGRGDNASALIYAASVGDFAAIDREAIDIVAVTGNSMGFYSALACAGALSADAGFRIANTMGRLMHEAMIGGQLVYPFVGDDWTTDPARKGELLDLVAEIGAGDTAALSLSIDLGGMLVIAGNEAGLAEFTRRVPERDGRFPMRLANHGAFHSTLQAPVSERARLLLGLDTFGQPNLPLIDGRGAIWWPEASDIGAIWDYTLGTQVTEPYDFTRAVTVAAREFAPDLFILAGPGAALGGAVAQSLVLAGWRGMSSKTDFEARQRDAPILCAMGREDQRVWAVNPG